VFFPTIVETHLGFLLQGPYRTTPSRDNVPQRDHWNQRCVRETAELLREALSWLRDRRLLDTAALRCLPIDRQKFQEGSMFAPLFDATKRALASDKLLPRLGGGHLAAVSSRLARTQELRELLGSEQLAALFNATAPLDWLGPDISQDRTPELRQYLMKELEIPELTPETVLLKLTSNFLSAQADGWIQRLYEFLNGQPALRSRATALPLVRRMDGTHVVAKANGQPQAFLPGVTETGFPTVRPTVCASDGARAFLRALGLTEPDPVDDVIWNVLPKYQATEVDVRDAQYEGDIKRILTAFATDSKGQREKLIAALRDTAFVIAVDTGDGSEYVSRPGEVYLATDRLKNLFAGVLDVLLVDHRYTCLHGEDTRELLEACGATRYLRPVPIEPQFTGEQRRQMRIAAGCESMSWQEPLEDSTLNGLDSLFQHLAALEPDARRTRSALLWEALGELEDRRGTGVFSGSYRWHYYHRRSTTFDATFVRVLNDTAWVPDQHGQLQRPELVTFDSLSWKPDPFLLSKIRFRPPIIEQLAREVGIEPGVLDLLKKLGVTSEAELRERLGVAAAPATENSGKGEDLSVGDALRNLLGDTPPPSTPAVPDPSAGDPVPAGGGRSAGHVSSTSTAVEHSARTGSPRERDLGHGSGPGATRTPSSAAGRPFISYVGTHPNDEEPDPDGLDQAARMALEGKAIDFIEKCGAAHFSTNGEQSVM
jgi:hypothetical protein